MNKIGTINGHTPVPRDDKRDSTGSGPVVTRQMTPEERERMERIKPYTPVPTHESARTRRRQL